MSTYRPWTDFTYLFKTRKQNITPTFGQLTQPDPVAVERRRRLEDIAMEREVRRATADVWD